MRLDIGYAVAVPVDERIIMTTTAVSSSDRLERVLELLAEIAEQHRRGDGATADEAAVADSAYRLGTGLVADGDLDADRILEHITDEIGDHGAPAVVVGLLSSVLDVAGVFA